MRACIDIGGTKVAVSLNDGSSRELVARRSEPTAKTGANDALALQVMRMVDEACGEAGVDAGAVSRAGVSSCGPFVMRGGMVEVAAPNICGGIAGTIEKCQGAPTSTVGQSGNVRFTITPVVKGDVINISKGRWERE